MKRIFGAFVKRPIKNFNVENRAQDFIGKNKVKPRSAPRHESTAQQIDDFLKDNPDLLEEQKKKNEALHARLQGMVANPDKVEEIYSRPLPTNTAKLEYQEFGFFEPDSVPEGKCSLRQAMNFISEHSMKPEEYTDSKIAEDFNLDRSEVKKILKHFHMYQLQVPKDPTRYDALDTSPITKAKQLFSKSNKEISSGQDK